MHDTFAYLASRSQSDSRKKCGTLARAAICTYVQVFAKMCAHPQKWLGFSLKRPDLMYRMIYNNHTCVVRPRDGWWIHLLALLLILYFFFLFLIRSTLALPPVWWWELFSSVLCNYYFHVITRGAIKLCNWWGSVCSEHTSQLLWLFLNGVTRRAFIICNLHLHMPIETWEQGSLAMYNLCRSFDCLM